MDENEGFPVPKWHIAVDGTPQGPLTVFQVQELANQGKIDLSSLAWCEEMTDWKPMGLIPSLVSVLQPLSPSLTASPPSQPQPPTTPPSTTATSFPSPADTPQPSGGQVKIELRLELFNETAKGIKLPKMRDCLVLVFFLVSILGAIIYFEPQLEYWIKGAVQDNSIDMTVSKNQQDAGEPVELGSAASPLTLNQLLREMNDNEARTIRKYKGKRITLRAQWDSIDQAMDGTPTLRVTDSSKATIASCTFRKNQREFVANADLSKELSVNALFEDGSKDYGLTFVDGVLNTMD